MSTWKSSLLRLGDKRHKYGTINGEDFKEDIETCFNCIHRDVGHLKDDILLYLMQCVEQLPHKIPFYATLLGLLNVENGDFVHEVVHHTQINLQGALDCGNCNRIRILIRFLTALMCSKVILPDSLVVVFETLLSSAATTVDEDKGNPCWQARADFYVTCILSALPWGGAELVEQVPEEIDRLLVEIEAYLRIRKKSYDTSSSPFADNSLRDPFDMKDFLEELWDCVHVLSQNGWNVDSVSKSHLFFEPQLVGGKSHELTPITCPPQPDRAPNNSWIIRSHQKHDADLMYPQRKRKLNIFTPDKFQSLQPIDCFILEEHLLDILFFFNGCRKECAAQMAGLPVPFRYEYVMAEIIFSQILVLPKPRFKPVYYTLVIIDLCKALPGAFPSVVASAVRALFERVGDLDMECRTRLELWFSHHLSNFQFIWPWDEWNHILELPKWAPQRLFVQRVLERGVRLSYWEKIKQSIEAAPGLEELLPPRGAPCFKYSDGGGAGTGRLSADLREMVRKRASSQEVIEWVGENILSLENGADVAVGVVTQTLLDVGSKSFTHLVTVLERYGRVIASLCPDEERQVKLVGEVASYWAENTQMMAVVVDRMAGYRLVSNAAVIAWAFHPENVVMFHVSDRQWEILRNTIGKTHNHIIDLRREISALEVELGHAKRSSEQAEAELEAIGSKLTLVDGQSVLSKDQFRFKRLKSLADRAKKEEVSVTESRLTKEKLLTRSVEESKELLYLLYRNLSAIASQDLTVPSSDAMDVDTALLAEPDPVKTGETAQWQSTILGYAKTFSRQYAREIWPVCGELDEGIFKLSDPLFRSAVYSGLGRDDAFAEAFQ